MSHRAHLRSASSDDALRGMSHLPSSTSSFFSENGSQMPQTPWRKISNGISQAWKARKARGLGDKTNGQTAEPTDIAQRFADLVENPDHLRLMKKPQLQSIAVIVNEVLPEGRRIDPWVQDKEELRNSIEDAFGFPRTVLPQAPRRSLESTELAASRFNSLSENCPPASALLATPASKTSKPTNSISYKPKRHSIDGLPSQGLRDVNFFFDSGSLGRTGRSRGTNGSLIPVSSKKKKTQAGLRTMFSQPNTMISLNSHRSPNNYLSSSPANGFSESSSPLSSPLASRSTHGSLNVLSPVVSRSNSVSAMHTSASTSLGGVISASSSGAAFTNSWGRHSRQSSGGSAQPPHLLVAEDLTMALLASRVESHGCVSASSSNSSVAGPSVNQQGGMSASRTRSRMSWMGTARFLDVVAEEEEETDSKTGSAEGAEDGDRPRKRRREATEWSMSSSGFRTRKIRGFRLPSMPSKEF